MYLHYMPLCVCVCLLCGSRKNSATRQDYGPHVDHLRDASFQGNGHQRPSWKPDRRPAALSARKKSFGRITNPEPRWSSGTGGSTGRKHTYLVVQLSSGHAYNILQYNITDFTKTPHWAMRLFHPIIWVFLSIFGKKNVGWPAPWPGTQIVRSLSQGRPTWFPVGCTQPLDI